ncbi:MAG: Hsp70 family protein [Myxococcota bacterium]
MRLGIDFGTTNSAVAVLRDDGQPRILELVPGERTQRTVIHSDLSGVITFGNEAFDRYLECDLRGRFLRSLKAFLPHDVPPTRIGHKTMRFVDLVARYLTFLAERAESVAGEPIEKVVVGRPVRFHADADRHERALANLKEAIGISGLPEPVLQLEPVAAALRYERTLDADRIVLVGDFGGGTADFAILKVGPKQPRSDERVLGTSGVAQAGDVLDGVFVDAFVLDFMGRGSRFVPRGAEDARAWSPGWLRQIRRLYDLHRLREPRLERFLQDLQDRTEDPVGIERVRKLVFDDLGYPLARAIERAKRGFSERSTVDFVFDAYESPRLNVEAPVERTTFAEASGSVLDAYEAAIDRVLELAGCRETDIDEVFLTGGTSQLPFLKARFEDRFEPQKVRGGEAFTTVCEGLALSFAA